MAAGYEDEELEEIKRRKLAELQRKMEEERQRRAQIDAALRQILTPEARERLANLRLVKPELAQALEEQLINLARSGRVKIPITDDFLKRLLAEIYEQTHRDTKIEIRRK
ncbi:DNA-binding TFAR19-related protein [Thermogladius calderae 1633]|uniref:DNA-binding protein TCELL_0377 n=1 Tax=Thermogladius calderae (strain DSM 22663 / VKM B-2946 / 1633) TaxID=1184251 RepID=I3TDG4_THEC1|nr:DNA-binding protein [Thermogladius calderae]AFK50802.1 DNA-binding TFAR19-related protein [Thermogladius calderae 1633]